LPAFDIVSEEEEADEVSTSPHKIYIPALKAEIGQLVNALYGLSGEEIT